MDLAVLEPQPVPAATPKVKPRRQPKARALTPWRQAGHLVLLTLLAVASYLFFSRYVLQTVEVRGQSMYPTLRNADHYFLNRWAFHSHPPQRGDIVVLRDPSDGVYVVKRVIAKAGESIFLKNGKVYINGAKLSEPYLPPGTPTFTETARKEELIVCGKDQYFVLGDNRNDSYDSRFYGPVQRQNILGAILY